jgi:L-alanine-DL-glutamate epimerase-like enolase superfamily enzyme
MQIVEIEALTIEVPLPAPLHLGAAVIERRELAAVRIRTDTEVSGHCIYVTRDVPVLRLVATLGPALVGEDALQRRALIARLDEQHRPARSAFARGVSLLETALWDIAAKSAGLPLWRLLGGARSTVPALQVCGYGPAGDGPESVEDEVRYFASRGVGLLKVFVPRVTSAETYELVARARDAAGSAKLAVDFHYGLSSVAEAAEICSRLESLDLLFIEDPFHPSELGATERLAARTPIPIAAGEDVASEHDYPRLARCVDILRIDALTVGGVGPALLGLAAAKIEGRATFPHGLPELNAQLAGADETILAAELVMTRAEGELAYSGMPVIDGHVHLPETPGIGLTLDWDELRHGATAYWSSTSSA